MYSAFKYKLGDTNQHKASCKLMYIGYDKAAFYINIYKTHLYSN